MKNRVQQSFLAVWMLALLACGGGGGGGGSTVTPPVVVTSSTAMSSSSTAPQSSQALVSSSSVTSSSTPSSSSSSQGISTTYTVSVAVPTSFVVQSGAAPAPDESGVPLAAADISAILTASNFAVVVVDLSGTVLEKFALQAGDVVNNNDGTWSVRAAGVPRADVLIVVDITKPINLVVGDSIQQNGLIFAPTTASSMDIDVGSTTGYLNFIENLGGSGSFSSQNIDPTSTAHLALVDHVINTVQELVGEQSLTSYTTVNQALAALKLQVARVVTEEVVNIQSAVPGTAVTLVRDEGGVYSYQSVEDNDQTDIYYNAIIGMESGVNYRFNGTTFVLVDESVEEPDFILSNEGWSLPGDNIRATAYNDDGSVTTELVNAPGVAVRLEAQQVFDLSNRNIRRYLEADVDTLPFAALTDANATFASGAKGYRIKSSFLQTLYVLPLDTASDSAGTCDTSDSNDGVLAANVGGNCNALGLWSQNNQYSGTLTDLANVFSPDVAVDVDGFKAVSLGEPIVVQLINDAGKTARFYLQATATPDSTVPQTILIGTGIWANVTLPHLQGEAANAIEVKMTKPLNEVNYLSSSTQYLLVKQEGFVRLAFGITPPIDVETSFNLAAHTSIVNAIVPGSASSERPVLVRKLVVPYSL